MEYNNRDAGNIRKKKYGGNKKNKMAEIKYAPH
jgi:hypothetical protein